MYKYQVIREVTRLFGVYLEENNRKDSITVLYLKELLSRYTCVLEKSIDLRNE